MAQYAANFTTTLQKKPSILEIIAQKSLNDTLYPALQKITRLIHSSSPDKFHWLRQHNEEIILLLNGLMQYYYFKQYDSAFSENFYGLKRVFVDGQTLSVSYKIFCATYVSVLPYLKNKLAEKHNFYKTQDVEGCLRNDFIDKLKKLFIFVYPILQTVWGAWLIVNYLKYMSGGQESQLPSLHLLNLKLIYSEEIREFGFWIPLFKGELLWTDFSRGIIKNFVMVVLEILAFSMQFTQSLNSIAPNFNLTALPKIPPPMVDNKSNNFKEKCPICRQYWKLPSVLLVSGYVFCFTCIVKYLREYQNCPVTKLPAKPLDIVRLFDGE